MCQMRPLSQRHYRSSQVLDDNVTSAAMDQALYVRPLPQPVIRVLPTNRQDPALGEGPTSLNEEGHP